MCGIVGFKTFKYFRELNCDLGSACDCMQHRGPDDSGIYSDATCGVGLAHRRLSIIDLSDAGRQPMTVSDYPVWIVFNGELYNFVKIRKSLIEKGHRFYSRTDTEVILRAYLEWGIDCLKKFVGMFALAIWDSKKQTLFLARDRIGKKPLYYHLAGDTLIFASELKAIRAFKALSLEVDPDAISLFLHFQYIPAPKTIYKKTSKLLPGHYLKCGGETLTCKPYWNLPGKRNRCELAASGEAETVSRLDSVLTDAVSDRLVSDVSLGALLSGGIDSSIVVALMQKLSTSPVRTFSIGFKEKGYNEAIWAKRVAGHLGTDHTELYVTPDEALDVISYLPKIYDEPFADSSAIPTYLVCKLARSQVTVALSGDGGDEQFCGYVRYWSTRAVASKFQRLPDAMRKTIAALMQALPSDWVESCYRPLRPFLPQRYKMENFSDKWLRLKQILVKGHLSELYRMTVCLWSEDQIYRLLDRALPESQYDDAFAETTSWPLLQRLMHVDQRTYLPDAMLVKVDRASMANSLEVRSPLLDHRVVEYTSNLPEKLKYRNGNSKYILKELLARYVPRKYFDRPKMGFGIPLAQWLRGDLKSMLLDYLSPESLKKEGLFDIKFIETKLKEHLSGDYNHQYRLWSLLIWEMWRRQWLR